MRKLTLIVLAIALVLTFSCTAIGYATDHNEYVPSEESAVPTEPFTWDQLATIAGAALFTLLVVQFFKVPLDKVCRIPTRVFAYFVALAAMLTATAFTTGLTFQSGLLAAVNAIIAALTAMGTYEVTFAKLHA